MNRNSRSPLSFTMHADQSFPAWPNYEEDEIAAVTEVLKSGRVNYWTGEQGRKFEQEFAAYTGCNYGIALANGTVGLELALMANNIGPGDSVVVPSRTYIATAGSVVVRGARPIFADVDPVSQNITVDTIKAVIADDTRAVIVVHLAGWPCDMDPIVEFCQSRDLVLIEDCAQAHGARYKDRPVGSFGDAASFSFCQDKIMSTGGEGGMLVTNDRLVWEKAWSYKDHGKNHQRMQEKRTSPGYQWVHDSIGTNWRMTEMQAAIGRLQLGKLDSWVDTRRCHAAMLADALADIPVAMVPEPPADVRHAYYKFYILLQPDYLQDDWDRDRILLALDQAGVPVTAGICSELYREAAFVDIGLGRESALPVAEQLGRTSLMFPVHPTLAESNISRMGEIIRSVLAMASR